MPLLSIAQLLDLVLHERDERRNHQRQASLHRGGKLVAEALAGAGGHDAEDVAPAEHILDHLALHGPELIQAKHAAKLFTKVRHASRARKAALGPSYARPRPVVWILVGPRHDLRRSTTSRLNDALGGRKESRCLLYPSSPPSSSSG